MMNWKRGKLHGVLKRILTAAIVFGLLAGNNVWLAVGPVARATVNGIHYRNVTVSNGQVSVSDATRNGVIEVSGSTTTWGSGTSETWYAVTENVTIASRIVVTGHVHLILCDGKKLTASNGITVDDVANNKLTIYAQSDGNNMGELEARAAANTYNSGIGGGTNQSSSGITINGGKITAVGDQFAAGIGGSENGSASDITINGGRITASSPHCGAGIGGGNWANGSNITINGGEITASSSQGGAGIGGGNRGAASNITINGGEITASGGVCGAGIGGGNNGGASYITINGGEITASGGESGAGIGGGNQCAGSDITINGGEITASSSKYGAGIGGGNIGAGSDITINGGEITASSSYCGAGIGGGLHGAGSGIIINGGKIVASSSEYGAGIGGGDKGNGGITISGGVIMANGGNGGAGIGGGFNGNATVTIQGGTVYAAGSTLFNGMGSAGIGSGSLCPETPTIVIKDLAIVSASGGSGTKTGAAIGKGGTYDANGEQVLDYSNLRGCILRHPAGKTSSEMAESQAGAVTMTGNAINPRIRFYPNGGAVSLDTSSITEITQYVNPGISTQLMENYFTKQGYTFTRWNTRIDGTGTSYSDKASIVTNESIILFAQWKVDHLTSPTISSQPVGTDLTEGYEDAYALSITASSPSEDAITYQWYSNTTDSSTGGTLIPGETNASYTIPTNLSVGTYYYYCEVSSTRGTETLTTKTGVATVTVIAALVTPTIDTEPVDLNLTEGYTTGSTLTVAASCATTGATLSYQWYSTPTGSTSDGTFISGATSASYDPASLTVGDHYYYCIVTATRSTETQSTTSRVAKITVAPATVPSSGNYSYYKPVPASGNYSYNKPAPASGNYSYNEPAPEPKFPGGEGWTGIVNEIGNITEGGQLEINMNGTTNLPSTVIETIKGKDINIVLDMGNGIKWTISGKDVTDSSKNTNMAVSLNSSLIPVDVINNLNKEHYTMQISLAQKGSFGFKATLTLPMRTQDAGLFANMFRYTKNVLKQSSLSIAANDASTPTGEFEFISAGRIAEDGSVNLEFDGTDGVGESTTETALAIIVDDHSLNPNIKPTPLTLKAASKAGKVTLRWNKVVGATKYRIYQKIGKKFKMLSEKKNNKLTIKKAYKTVMKKGKKKTELKKLIIGQKYTFAVKAYVDGKWQKITAASTKDVKIS